MTRGHLKDFRSCMPGNGEGAKVGILLYYYCDYSLKGEGVWKLVMEPGLLISALAQTHYVWSSCPISLSVCERQSWALLTNDQEAHIRIKVSQKSKSKRASIPSWVCQWELQQESLSMKTQVCRGRWARNNWLWFVYMHTHVYTKHIPLQSQWFSVNFRKAEISSIFMWFFFPPVQHVPKPATTIPPLGQITV